MVIPEDKKIAYSISEITPYLYLSGYGCLTEAKLHKMGITHCVDATNLSNRRPKGMEYLEIPVEDIIVAKLSHYFDKVLDMVGDAKAKGGKCLVFCAAGVSRSAALVLAALIQHEGKTLKEAYQMVNHIRPIISPNIGFWRQLIDFEVKLKGTATVKMITGRLPRPVPDVYLHRSEA